MLRFSVKAYSRFLGTRTFGTCPRFLPAPAAPNSFRACAPGSEATLSPGWRTLLCAPLYKDARGPRISHSRFAAASLNSPQGSVKTFIGSPCASSSRGGTHEDQPHRRRLGDIRPHPDHPGRRGRRHRRGHPPGHQARTRRGAERLADGTGRLLAPALLRIAHIHTRQLRPPGPPPTDPFLSSRVPADDPSRDSLPPSILPVVILKGSDYEMGFQYGEQACAYIDRTREDKWAAALRRFSRDEVLRALRANQSFIGATRPSGSTSCAAWPTARRAPAIR
jgi:hypothetical protein